MPDIEFDPVTGLIKTPSGPTKVEGASHNDLSAVKGPHAAGPHTLDPNPFLAENTPVIPPTEIPGAKGTTNPMTHIPEQPAGVVGLNTAKVTKDETIKVPTPVIPLPKHEPESPNPPTGSTVVSTVQPPTAAMLNAGSSSKLVAASEARLNRQQQLYIQIQDILDEYGHLESNIPITHNYWALLNEYRSLR